MYVPTWFFLSCLPLASSQSVLGEVPPTYAFTPVLSQSWFPRACRIGVVCPRRIDSRLVMASQKSVCHCARL